jgi:hypothetical protein
LTNIRFPSSSVSLSKATRLPSRQISRLRCRYSNTLTNSTFSPASIVVSTIVSSPSRLNCDTCVPTGISPLVIANVYLPMSEPACDAFAKNTDMKAIAKATKNCPEAIPR